MNEDTVILAGRPVHRVGFGAMQLPGPGVLGPPANRSEALAVLNKAVDSGVDHIDTAQFYGPDVANELIHEALHPYPAQLVLVSKVGARRGDNGEWLGAQTPEALRSGIEDNLRTLELDQIPVVNLRRHDGGVPFSEQIDAMKSFRDEGLIGAIGLSNVTLDEYNSARAVTEIACVQNAYSVANRQDEPLFAACRSDGVPYVPFFPLGSAFVADNPILHGPVTTEISERLGTTTAQVALAWLLARAPSVLLIPGTSKLAHLEQNLAAADVVLSDADMDALDRISNPD
jgi:pyridoxine 4-dehydrogenase